MYCIPFQAKYCPTFVHLSCSGYRPWSLIELGMETFDNYKKSYNCNMKKIFHILANTNTNSWYIYIYIYLFTQCFNEWQKKSFKKATKNISSIIRIFQCFPLYYKSFRKARETQLQVSGFSFFSLNVHNERKTNLESYFFVVVIFEGHVFVVVVFVVVIFCGCGCGCPCPGCQPYLSNTVFHQKSSIFTI